MTGLLEGKRLLVTGVLTDKSIAYSVARLAVEQGATVVLSGFGRGLSLTTRIAKRLPGELPVIELDVTSEEHLARLPEQLSPYVDGLDGVLHAIGFAPAGRSATASSTRPGRTSRRRCRCRPGRTPPSPAPAAP